MEVKEPSDDLLVEQSYLIARGVRALAIVGWCAPDPMLMLRIATRLESVGDPNCLAFVLDHHDGQATFGYAAARWVLELYAWSVTDVGVPQEQRERITGLLLGYTPEAIARYESYTSGRRFLLPNESRGQAAS